MTLDYIEIGERTYELVPNDGPIVCVGVPLDFYVDHDAQRILFDGALPCDARSVAIARAVSLAWREHSRPKLQTVPFAGAVD